MAWPLSLDRPEITLSHRIDNPACVIRALRIGRVPANGAKKRPETLSEPIPGSQE